MKHEIWLEICFLHFFYSRNFLFDAEFAVEFIYTVEMNEKKLGQFSMQTLYDFLYVIRNSFSKTRRNLCFFINFTLNSPLSTCNCTIIFRNLRYRKHFGVLSFSTQFKRLLYRSDLHFKFLCFQFISSVIVINFLNQRVTFSKKLVISAKMTIYEQNCSRTIWVLLHADRECTEPNRTLRALRTEWIVTNVIVLKCVNIGNQKTRHVCCLWYKGDTAETRLNYYTQSSRQPTASKERNYPWWKQVISRLFSQKY